MDHMMTYLDQYKELAKIIEKRPLFESDKSENSLFKRYKTTIDYPDVDGNTLLHYACMLGDLEKVKELIAQGADLNKESAIDYSPLRYALYYGHLEVAKWLFEQGATCYNIPLSNCSGDCKEWFSEKIRKTLYDSTFKDQFFQNSIKKNKNEINKSIRAIESGSDMFVYEHVKSRDISKINKMLMTAFECKIYFFVNLLLTEYGASINAEKPYTTAPIHVLAQDRSVDWFDYLFSKGVDIDAQNQYKETALYLSIVHENKNAVKKLLGKNANISLETINGETVFHAAAKMGDSDIFALLLQRPDATKLLSKKNIFGETALDLAVKNKDMGIIRLINGPWKDEYDKQLISDQEESIDIDQGSILKKLRYFLKSQYCDDSLVDQLGACNGFSFLEEHYHAMGMEDYYFDTLRLFSNWDGSEEALKQPFVSEAQMLYGYHNLGELMEQWINDIVWFQQELKGTFSELEQDQRFEQNEMVEANPLLAPVILITDCYSINDLEQVKELAHYFKRLPEGCRFEFKTTGADEGHATAGHVGPDSTLIYYDPNIKQKTIPSSSSEEFAQRLIDHACIGIGYGINVKWCLFCFKKDVDQLKELPVLLEEEIPKTKEESVQFQKKSPNGFTPLHLAVMFKNTALVKRLIMEGHCDVNAKDKYGRTVLDLALSNNYLEGMDVLFSSSLQLFYHDSAFDKISKLTDTSESVQYMINSPHPFDLTFMLEKAIKNKELPLIEQLFEKKKIKINEEVKEKTIDYFKGLFVGCKVDSLREYEVLAEIVKELGDPDLKIIFEQVQQVDAKALVVTKTTETETVCFNPTTADNKPL